MSKPRSLVLAGVAVAVALVAGIVVAVLVLGGGGSVALPDEIGDYQARDSDAAVSDSVDNRDEVLAGLRGAREYAAQQFSDAFDGADADVRSYVEDGDGDSPQYLVTAVEADAGPLLPEFGFDDPEYVGFAVPLTERVEEGDAECLLRRSSPPAADSDYDEEDTAPSAVICQRTSNALTVRVSAGNDPSVEDTAEFLDTVWSELD